MTEVAKTTNPIFELDVEPTHRVTADGARFKMHTNGSVHKRSQVLGAGWSDKVSSDSTDRPAGCLGALDPSTVKYDSRVLIRVQENPPLGIALFLGLQHFLCCFGILMGAPMLLGRALKSVDPEFSESDAGSLVATTVFCGGLGSLFQTTLTHRMPILQGLYSAHLILHTHRRVTSSHTWHRESHKFCV